MNTKNMHGRQIARVVWPNGDALHADDRHQIHMSATYHGDRDEFWIVLRNREGLEIGRYNPRYVESIAWSEPWENKIDEHP